MNPALAAICRRNFVEFIKAIRPELIITHFHLQYYLILAAFALGLIRKLIITIPPQHGKSEGSSRLLPAFMLGRNPNLRVAIGSYGGSYAQGFNRSVQRNIENSTYRNIFPGTRLPRTEAMRAGNVPYVRTGTLFEILDCEGSLKAVGVKGPLTGDPVDVMIMDDLYKDNQEANSPVRREVVWSWYTDVVRSRYHNGTQELLVFTRWHEDDLIGRLIVQEGVQELTSLSQIGTLDPDKWVHINWEAIKESEPTEIDPRQPGEPLFPERHSLHKLEQQRELNPLRFACMQQGKPEDRQSFLYGDFDTYERLPEVAMTKGNYTDTADQGDDYLCSVCFSQGRDGRCYVTDVVYTQDPMEDTEKYVPMMFERTQTKEAIIESNNGGRGFARVVQQAYRGTAVEWFHQSDNKEGRIRTNSALVTQNIVFPVDWQLRWPEFARHVISYKRKFSANKFHDAPDVLTGIVEKYIAEQKPRGIRRRN